MACSKSGLLENIRATGLLCLLLASFCSTNAFAEKAHIAVAANFSHTVQTLASEFKKQFPEHDISFSYASSGKLYAQIIHGAPFDAFLSADQSYITQLEQKSLTLHESQFTYAIGKLVFISAKQRPDIHTFDSVTALLSENTTGKIAIAHPDYAPYGIAARTTLENLKLWNTLQDRLVSGENINQAYQFVASHHAGFGFVALSSLMQTEHSKTYILVPEQYYAPIKQDAVLLQQGKNNTAAIHFLEFLKQESAQKIIKSQGYHI